MPYPDHRHPVQKLMDICDMRISDEVLLNGLTMGEARVIVRELHARNDEILALHEAKSDLLAELRRGAVKE